MQKPESLFTFRRHGMPEKDFEIWLNDTTRILVSRTTEKGALISFAVILMVLHEGAWTDAGRYDTAHGVPHQDVLHHRKGLVKKVWMDKLSAREIYAHAIENFRKNYSKIIHEYLT